MSEAPNEQSNSNIKELHTILIGKLPKLVRNGRESLTCKEDSNVSHHGQVASNLIVSPSTPQHLPLLILHNTLHTLHSSPVLEGTLKWMAALGYITFLPSVHRITVQSETVSLSELNSAPQSAVVRMEQDPGCSLLCLLHRTSLQTWCAYLMQNRRLCFLLRFLAERYRTNTCHAWALCFSSTSERPIASYKFFIQPWVDFMTGLFKKSILPVANIWTASK